MNRTKIPVVIVLSLCLVGSIFSQAEKNRLIVLADMGNEPDEEQQMVHMMLYNNEFDLEGLVAVTGKFLRPESNIPYKQKLHPELFHEIIDCYEKVWENLKLHAEGWHEPRYLKDIVAVGQSGYGIADTGVGKSSEGSKLIEKVLLREDDRPLYIVVNAGSNTLAQTLIDLQQKLSKKKLDEVVSKIRVYENGAQDNAGAWICREFPSIHWVRSNYQTYSYGGPSIDGGADNKGERKNLGPYTWEPYSYDGIGQHQWLLEHIIGNHGWLGTKYPIRQFRKGGISFMEGGGTIPWLPLVNQGLNDIDKPWYGGWGGLFTREKVKNVYSKHTSVNVDEKEYGNFFLYTERPDKWVEETTGIDYSGLYAPVWRWRRAFVEDFKCRMDWCTQSYKNANHAPIIVLNGDTLEKIHEYNVKAGESLLLDATGTKDPDGDYLNFNWWVYPEAGTFNGTIDLPRTHTPKLSVTVPQGAKGSEIHLILEVYDVNDIGRMTDYRRIVLTVI